MKVFISYASANAEIASAFKALIKSIIKEEDIDDVFCTADDGSIPPGNDFVRFIMGKLDNCDAFVPLISNDYYKSRFSMTELGIACSFFFQKDNEHGLEYLYPFAVFPIRSSYALSNTPLRNLQVANINSKEDLYSFFTGLAVERGVRLLPNIRNKISSFVYDVDRILLESHDIISNAKYDTYIDDRGYYKNRAEIVQHSKGEDGITVNFNLDPEERKVKWTDFFSLALVFIDDLDLGRYYEIDPSCTFDFILNNFTNSLKTIDVEFKRGRGGARDTFAVFTRSIEPGENSISIPFSDMECGALHNVSEICFVVHPEKDVVESEGMFKLSDIKVRLG